MYERPTDEPADDRASPAAAAGAAGLDEPSDLDDPSDLDEPTLPDVPWRERLDLGRLREPPVLFHLADAVFALLILLWPDRSTVVLGRLLGLALVVGALILLVGSLRQSVGGRSRPVVLVSLVVVGAALVAA